MSKKKEIKIDWNDASGQEEYRKITNTRIRNELRNIWRTSRIRAEALKRARVGKGIEARYKCAICGKLYSIGDVTVDHIRDVGDNWHLDWNRTIERLLFCSIDNLQVLDRVCHREKTAKDKTAAKLEQLI